MELDEQFWRENHILTPEIVKVERKIRLLQLDYEAEFETYTEFKEDKKIEELKKKFNLKMSVLNKKKQKYQEEREDFVKRKMLEQRSRQEQPSKMQIFMDILKSLEGEQRNPVLHQDLVRELHKTGVFSKEDANEYIRRMLREASIYESRPNYYNRV